MFDYVDWFVDFVVCDVCVVGCVVFVFVVDVWFVVYCWVGGWDVVVWVWCGFGGWGDCVCGVDVVVVWCGVVIVVVVWYVGWYCGCCVVDWKGSVVLVDD